MIDIVFQNGDFFPQDSSFLQDILTATIGALIGTGGAIFVYWLQIQRDRDIKKANEYNQNKSDLEYFQLVLHDAIKFIESQKEIIKDYANAIANDPYKTENVNSFPTLPLVRLEKINHEKIHHIFLSSQGTESNKLFKNIYKYIDFFNESFKVIDIHIDRDAKELQDMKMNYTKAFADIIDEVSKKTNKIKYTIYNGNSVYKYDRLFALLDKIILDFYEGRIDTTDLEYHQSNFVRPLNTGLVLEGHLGDSDCVDITIASKKATHLYSDIGFKSKNLSIYINDYYTALDENLSKFTNAVHSISPYKLIFNKKWHHFLYTPGQ